MTEMTREQIKKVKKDYQNGAQKIDIICDMALRTHDAEQRAEQAEAERDNLRETRQIEIRATEQWREKAHEARQEAANLRDMLGAAYQELQRLGAESVPLQSAPPASEQDDGWTDFWRAINNASDPAPADRPEPNEALEDLKEIENEVAHWCERWYETDAKPLFDNIRRHMSQPAPAAPDAVRRLPLQWRIEAKTAGTLVKMVTESCANELERALPADGDSPAVPDGYVLVPEEPTLEMVGNGREYIESGITSTYALWKVMVAAAPTPTDDGGNNAIYFEVNESTADDVAKSLRTGADAVDRLQRVEELLRELSDHFDDYADVIDSDRGIAEVPNEAMQWRDRINKTLGENHD